MPFRRTPSTSLGYEYTNERRLRAPAGACLAISLVLIASLASCNLPRPSPTATLASPVTQAWAPTSAPSIAVPLVSPTLEPAPQDTPVPDCQTHTAEMEIELSSAEIQVGEPLTVTGTLINQGCAMLGLPLYTLLQAPAETMLFEPVEIEPVLHSLGISDGGQDQVQFVLTAREPGVAQLSISASVEVHLGYPGPAYWATVSSAAADVAVLP